MKKLSATIIFFILLVSACNMPGPSAASPTISPDLVATQVASLLTAAPTAAVVTTDAPHQPAATPSATTAPQESSTATAEVTQPEPTSAPTTAIQPTEATQPTQATQPTAAPTVTVPSSDPRQSLGSASWTDDFTNELGWPTGEDKFTDLEIEDGYLKLTSKEDVDGWRLTYPELDDFYLEATLRSEDCGTTDHYGLIFRVPDKTKADEGYLFGISCEGKYSLRKWNGEKMTALVPWTSNSVVLAGSNQVNRLGVLAKGSKIAIYVNGVLLKELEDESYSEGAFGIFVGSNKTHDVTVSVDQVAYWDNP